MNTGRNISLTEHLNRFIDTQVDRGRHQNASEVVREALRRYERTLAEDDARLEALRAIAADGRLAIERGDYVMLDGPDEISNFLDSVAEEASRDAEEKRADARRD